MHGSFVHVCAGQATARVSLLFNAPTVLLQEYTKKKIADFLHNHTAYELIPESGKVTDHSTSHHMHDPALRMLFFTSYLHT